jgi:hypothetical protein
LFCLLQLFFAKIPPSVSSGEVESLFKAFGEVVEVNLFKAWAGAKSSKVGARQLRVRYR